MYSNDCLLLINTQEGEKIKSMKFIKKSFLLSLMFIAFAVTLVSCVMPGTQAKIELSAVEDEIDVVLGEAVELEFTATENDTYKEADILANLKYESSDKTVVNVEKDGLVAVGVGSATITATWKEDTTVSATVKVNVTAPEVGEVVYSDVPAKVFVGEEFEITYEASEEVTVAYESSDLEVLAVEGNKVTALAAGTATITATCKYQPSVSASVEVTVSELQADLTDIYVDASFTGYEAAAAITINNKIYYYGLTAFNNLSEALAVATGKVTVAAGTYEGASSVVNSNVTILGPNANVNPVIGVRGDEAVIKGTEQSFRAYSPERLVKAVQAQGQPQSLIDRYAEIARRERLAEQILGDGNRASNFYAATKKLWQGKSPQARNAAIVKQLDTPKVREYLGMSPDEPFTILDALRYVEQKRSDFVGEKIEDELKESAGEGNGKVGSDPILVVAGQLAVSIR